MTWIIAVRASGPSNGDRLTTRAVGASTARSTGHAVPGPGHGLLPVKTGHNDMDCVGKRYRCRPRCKEHLCGLLHFRSKRRQTSCSDRECMVPERFGSCTGNPAGTPDLHALYLLRGFRYGHQLMNEQKNT